MSGMGCSMWVFPFGSEPVGRSGDDLIVSDGEGLEAIPPLGGVTGFDFTFPCDDETPPA